MIAAAEAAARDGAWVLGGLGYAARIDPVQQALPGGPAAHFEVYPDPPEDWPPEPAPLPALDWRPAGDFGGRRPRQAIAQVLSHIAAGDCYQVNLTTRWRAPRPADSDGFHRLFLGLAAAQPGGYAFYSALAGVASVSPELFFDYRENRLVTQPMKGTGADPEVLRNSPKEQAENLMIVDLLRNDLARVCRTGTVTVERLFELHRLPTLWQLTSTVAGETAPDTTLAEIFTALFPCGSVTGAPKLAAMAVIAELEDAPRGWYCGALGVLRPGGTATFNVPIRTVTCDPAAGLSCGVGSGVVADSTPGLEEAEWRAKTAFLGGRPLRALETMLLDNGEILRRGGHLARLTRTCAALGLPLELAEVTAALAQASAQHPTGRHRLRLVAGDGPPSIELSPAPAASADVHLAVAAEPLDTDGWLAPVIRNKTTHRGHYQRLLDLAEPGVFDVICHNGRGELTECTTGNLALRLGGQWFTPPASAGLLPGVLRAELLTQGRLRERQLTLADLDAAEAVAFLNSLRGWCAATWRSH